MNRELTRKDTLNHIASTTCTFVRSQVRKLKEFSDDEKVSAVMAITAIASSVFIEAFGQFSDQPINTSKMIFLDLIDTALNARIKP